MKRGKLDLKWLALSGSEEENAVKAKVPSHRRQLKQRLLLVVLFLSSSLWILFQVDLNVSSRIERIRFSLEDEASNSPAFIVNTPGCRIQNLDAFDPSITEFVFQDTDPACGSKNGRVDPVIATVDSLYVDKDALRNLSAGLGSNVSCCYRRFWRETQPVADVYSNDVDDVMKTDDTCVPFFDAVKVPYEFVSVFCNDSLANPFYEDYFAFAQPTEYETVEPSNDNDDKVNVLIVGVDALSRLNFYRQLPSVMTFLENREFIELLGYNKVGDNTFPNLIPFLTGLSEEELGRICWKSSDSVFDDCFFLWDHFKNNGYVTGFGEDSVDIALFQYQKVGFREKPTDFYSHPYHRMAEKSIGTDKWMNCKLCIGQRYSFQLVLDDALSFAVNLKNNSNFGFFWINSISHDYLNLPRFANYPLLSFFQQLETNGILNSTVVVLMSDHGIRWGGIRSTYQGYIEERLPGLFMLFPRWFRNRYGYAYANIRQNRRRLTTPFDVHETLLDLANLSRLADRSIFERSKNVKFALRGSSLFLPVPSYRTCSDAGISPHWCTCRKAKTLPLQAPIVKKLASALVDHLNGLISTHRQCAPLALHKITQTRIETVSVAKGERLNSAPSKDYIVTIETQPGLGVFEATIRVSPRQRVNFTVIPPVSRINTYGNQSACMTDFHLKLYCYCSSLFGHA